jgi:outer membrane protein TolC
VPETTKAALTSKAPTAGNSASGKATTPIRTASASNESKAAQEPEPATKREPGVEDPEAPEEIERPETSPELSGEVKLNDAPLESGDLNFPINLATALRLSDARPLVVAAAQASAWVAEAQLQRAQVIWVPQLNMGADYIRHDGFGPDFNRGLNTSQRPLNQNINFLYTGLGLTQGFALADAIFEPLAARQVLDSRRWDIQSAKNDALLATANAYFDVHLHRGEYAGALDVVDRGEKLVERITELSEDLVPKVEVDRARRFLATAQQNAASRRELWRVASANLTQVLRLDPRVVVDPAEHDHTQITLIEPDRPLSELIPMGLTNRPELASNQSLVNAVAERIRRERGRILMPSILFNGFQTPNEMIQVGAQGFGFDRNLNLWSTRSDFSPQVVWQLEGLGYGNLARIKEQRGEQSKAIVELFKTQDAVAADVTRAQARVQSAAVRVSQAERAMSEALITYEGNYEGLRQTKRFENVLIQVYRPQEAVVALNDLMLTYDRYFSTVADYNKAQFEMYHALGYPAIEITDFNPPGEVGPVDTSRPEYLPPVGEGPPPATR